MHGKQNIKISESVAQSKSVSSVPPCTDVDLWIGLIMFTGLRSLTGRRG